MQPTIGDRAPDFQLLNEHGEKIRLRDQKGKPIVLIFYPGDMTPGCTLQLCSIRDEWEDFKEAGISVFGINPAAQGSHLAFQERHQFPFPLLVDEKKRTAKAYGALRKLLGIEVVRRTVIGINPQGIICYEKTGMPKTSDILKAMKRHIAPTRDQQDD